MSNELTTEQLESLLRLLERVARTYEGILNGKYERSDYQAARYQLQSAMPTSTCVAIVKKLIEKRESATFWKIDSLSRICLDCGDGDKRLPAFYCSG